MPGRLDPPHERVVLTSAEQLALARLEKVFERDRAGAGVGLVPHRRRSRVATLRRLWLRWAPCVTVVGAVVMVAAVSASLVVSAAGAAVAGIGFAGCLVRARTVWSPR